MPAVASLKPLYNHNKPNQIDQEMNYEESEPQDGFEVPESGSCKDLNDIVDHTSSERSNRQSGTLNATANLIKQDCLKGSIID